MEVKQQIQRYSFNILNWGGMEQQFYEQIKRILSDARNKEYRTANFAMVEAYCNIGKSIVEQQDGCEKQNMVVD